MAQQMYSLVENEVVLMEVGCRNFAGGETNAGNALIDKLTSTIKGIIRGIPVIGPCLCGVDTCIFVVTDKRCFAVIKSVRGCILTKEERRFIEFPVSAFSGWNFYSKSSCSMICFTSADFSIHLGLKKTEKILDEISFTPEFKTDEQAQALIQKVDELAHLKK